MPNNRYSDGQCDGKLSDPVDLIKVRVERQVERQRAVKETWQARRQADPTIPLIFERLDLIKAAGGPGWDQYETYLRLMLDGDAAESDPLEPEYPGLGELRDRLSRLRLEDFVETKHASLTADSHAERLARLRRIMRRIKRALRGMDDQMMASVQGILEEELLRRA